MALGADRARLAGEGATAKKGVGGGGPPGSSWADWFREEVVRREELLDRDSTKSSSSWREEASESRSASVIGRESASAD